LRGGDAVIRGSLEDEQVGGLPRDDRIDWMAEDPVPITPTR